VNLRPTGAARAGGESCKEQIKNGIAGIVLDGGFLLLLVM